MKASPAATNISPISVRYASVATPIGPVWIAGTSEGVLRVSLRSRTERAFLAALRAELGPSAIEASRREDSFESIKSQLRRYFRGELDHFSVMVDLGGLTSFQRKVLAATVCVPYGRVVPYGAIARAIGSPGASRAVGNALGRNPVSILVPCHRVVASNGTIGGFTGGTSLKRKLLAIEGIGL